MFFDDFMKTANNSLLSQSVQNENDYTIVMEVPGFSEDEISVEAKEKSITVRCDHEKEGTYFRKTLFQSWILPPSVNIDEISASVKNGILTVVLPKKTEVKKEVRKIAVTSGNRLYATDVPPGYGK